MNYYDYMRLFHLAHSSFTPFHRAQLPTLNRLVVLGLATKEGASFRITEAGSNLVYAVMQIPVSYQPPRPLYREGF